MRWNCPHCGVGLNVPDDQLGEGWCFSKCFQCSGFSLVRRADKEAVRVDQPTLGASSLPSPMPETSPLLRSPRKRAIEINPGAQALKKSPVQDLASQMSSAKVSPPPFKLKDGNFAGRALPPPLAEPSPRSGRSGQRLIRVLAGLMVSGVVLGVYTWLSTPIPVTSDSVTTAQSAAALKQPETTAPKSPSQEIQAKAIELKAPPAAPREVMQVVQEVRVTGFEVEPLSPRVQLRSGPGLTYPVIGVTGPSHSYPVVDWSERWFRIATENHADGTPKTFAWVRNDLVKLQKKQATR
jgi:hypothetical protein